MGRRSDHTRGELHTLILEAGEALMADVGYARFSAREVAKRVGYSIGTIHNVFGNVDGLVTAINTATFALWAAELRSSLANGGDDRLAALVEGYFRFARREPNRWAAIYDHRPANEELPPADDAIRSELTGIVVAEVAAALGHAPDAVIGTLARSLIATVHGHCTFALSGTWEAMGLHAPEAAALSRVRETIAAARIGQAAI